MLFPASLQAQTDAADVPKLLEDLNSKDPATRGAAATALDTVRDPVALPMLVSALQHAGTNLPLCKVLIRTLGKFDDAKAVAAVAELLPGDAGIIASQQLFQMGQRGIQAVVDATASDDETTKANVKEAFKSVPELGLKVLPPVLKTSKLPRQRAMIVSVLADSAAENPWYEQPPRYAFVEGFLPAASDESPVVRTSVAAAIQALAETEKELEDPGMGHPDFGLSRALPALKSLADDRDAQVRVAAMDALGAIGGTDAISVLKTHASDPDATVRAHVASGLIAAALAPEPSPSLQPTAKPGEQHAATQASAGSRNLAMIKGWSNETAIPKLIPLLRDPSSLVRAAAADKLGKLDYRSTGMNGEEHQQDLSEVPALIEILKDSHALVRAAAAEALGAIGDEAAPAPLIALLKDPKPKVVVAAAGALSALVSTGQGYSQDVLSPEDHEAAGNALVGLLSNSDESVRHAAISALINVGTLDNMRQIVPLLQDNDVIVRNQAANALARAFYPNPNSERPPEIDALEQAAGPALAEALSDPQTRGPALSALHAMNSPPAAAAHPIAEILKYNVLIHVDGIQRPEIQGAFDGFQGLAIDDAIDVLANTGSPEAEPLLVKFLNTLNPEAAKHATADWRSWAIHVPLARCSKSCKRKATEFSLTQLQRSGHFKILGWFRH
jgi:HEAT repeat protein